MLFGILIGGIVAMFLGVPLLPVLVVSAILQSLLTYAATKNRQIIANLIGLGMVLVTAYLLIPIITKDSEEFKSIVDTMSAITPWVIGIGSLLLIAHATFVGVFDIKDSSESNEA